MHRKKIIISIAMSAILIMGNAAVTAANPISAIPGELEVPAESMDDIQESSGEDTVINDAQTNTEGIQTDAEGGNVYDIVNDESSSEHQHDASCGYRAAQTEIPCDHVCVDVDGDGIVDHCPECAYRPALEELPCNYVPELLPEVGEENQEQSNPTGPEEGTAEGGDTESPDSQFTKKEDEIEAEENGQNQQEPSTDAAEEPSTDTEGTGETTEGNQDSIEGTEEKVPDNIQEEIPQEETPLPSNEPAYEVEIPSQVVLSNEMESFTIQTKQLQANRDGSLTVTVEGTESPDREYYALYCGESCWKYQLQIGTNILLPTQNKAILNTESQIQEVNVLPAGNNNLYAGTYTGYLTFHVAFEESSGAEN